MSELTGFGHLKPMQLYIDFFSLMGIPKFKILAPPLVGTT